MGFHEPVLREEALDNLAIRADGVYVDATFGRGGHAAGILQRLGPGGCLMGIDRDPEAVAYGQKLFGDDARVRIVKGNLSMLGNLVERAGLNNRVDGIVMDLGLSSAQLDDPRRGFSFTKDGPLDMRMDPGTGPSAADWLAQTDESEISRILKTYGEERYHRRIARAIVDHRDGHGTEPARAIVTTRQLAAIVEAAVPTREKKKHPATRTFQAIRISINRELEELTRGLDQAVGILAPHGRLCVISFHSLEDRIVKRFVRDRSREAAAWAGLPEIPHDARPSLRRIGRAVRPSPEEVQRNPRARSALLRVAERLS